MKKGIKIIEENIGSGPIVHKGATLKIRYDLYLNKGEIIQKGFETDLVLGDRNVIAGLNYGIEGMQEGGKRKFQASPHLCYRDKGVHEKIPPSAILIFDLVLLKIIKT